MKGQALAYRKLKAVEKAVTVAVIFVHFRQLYKFSRRQGLDGSALDLRVLVVVVAHVVAAVDDASEKAVNLRICNEDHRLGFDRTPEDRSVGCNYFISQSRPSSHFVPRNKNSL